jgi:CheY-like chemotaxis protein
MSALILVVDDEWLNRELMEGILTIYGYRVTLASNGKAALKAAVEKHPDLILADVRMPDMDGIELCSNLNGQDTTHTIPIILLTALDIAHEEEKMALDCGAAAILSRSTAPDTLIQRIKALL